MYAFEKMVERDSKESTKRDRDDTEIRFLMRMVIRSVIILRMSMMQCKEMFDFTVINIELSHIQKQITCAMYLIAMEAKSFQQISRSMYPVTYRQLKWLRMKTEMQWL